MKTILHGIVSVAVLLWFTLLAFFEVAILARPIAGEDDDV